MAATACLYNLSKEFSDKLHPSVLRRIIEVDLNAMEEFPQVKRTSNKCRHIFKNMISPLSASTATEKCAIDHL